MDNDKGPVTTQNFSTEPLPFVREGLERSVGSATDLFNRGVGSNPFPGSPVIPFSQQTESAMDAIQGGAQAARPVFQGAFDRAQGVAEQGGYSPVQQESVDALRSQMAGDRLTADVPFQEAVIDRSAQRMSDAVNQMASSMGRFGSGAHQGVLAREIGDMSNRAYLDNYNRERGYQQDAIGSAFNAEQQRRANIYGDPAALSGAYEATLAPEQDLMGVGSQYEDLATRLKNDEIRRFEEAQSLPWENIARYNAALSGAGQYGTKNVTAQGPEGPGLFQRVAGGALAGSGFGWPGMAVGGLAGLARR